MADDRWFEQLAEAADAEDPSVRTPARLKSRIFSTLTANMAARGRLLNLSESHAGGRSLCVFEQALAVLPLGDDLKSRNPCRVCHARILGERLKWAPIFWPGCPYSEFHNG
jgi:hypothetical protein